MATPDYLRVYPDHMASTPIDEAVLETLLPRLRAAGNPHSRHDLGQRAHEAEEKARSQIGSLIGPVGLVATLQPSPGRPFGISTAERRYGWSFPAAARYEWR